jgi:hypothetical protein
MVKRFLAAVGEVEQLCDGRWSSKASLGKPVSLG